MSEFDDNDESYMEFIIEDGKIKNKPETIEITMDDFNKLQKGLKLLKEKYPKISKECFN